MVPSAHASPAAVSVNPPPPSYLQVTFQVSNRFRATSIFTTVSSFVFTLYTPPKMHICAGRIAATARSIVAQAARQVVRAVRGRHRAGAVA
jgi:hypothetical protein